MSNPLTQTPHYWPKPGKNSDPETTQAIRQAFNGINDHDTAIVNLSGQVTTLQATVKSLSDAATAAATAAVTPTPPPTTTVTPVAPINNQVGTTYATQNTDGGGLVTLNNAAAVAVTLNNAVVVGFYCNIENLGAGLTTLTPASGTINGVASISLAQGQSCWVYFDGANWWASTGVSAVTSVFGRTGAVVAVSGDYSVGQVTNAMNKTGDTFTGTLSGPGQQVVCKEFIADVAGAGSGYVFQGGDALESTAAGHLELVVGGTTKIDVTTAAVTISIPTFVTSLGLTAASTATTATLGTSSALPATPQLYLSFSVNGTTYKIPLYNV